MSRRTRPHNAAQKKLKILVDMDQVLCDFEGGFLSKYQEKFPDEPFIPLEERNTFYIVDQYTKLRRDLQDKAREILHAEGFFLGLQPIEGARDALMEMWQMDDTEVFICTSPHSHYKYCVFEKFKWVEDHLGEEWINRLILTKDKTMVNGDLLIDDRPRIRGALDPPAWKQVLFSAPYNLSIDSRGRQRLNNWTDGQWRNIVEDFKKRI
ncbi:5'(3')-deoxyribonucleotidase, cytosolic type-like [Babylonia areolata]|uniref:5'(3')-deoxyribonucleotidase, cytosolic type-like n=1 Tax=Babylonia areolata TaxID=304850 RepID=UPI003FCEEE84